MQHYFFSSRLLISCHASRGRITRIPNLLAAAARCRSLNVTRTSAPPFTALSSTISSPGSLSCGRHRKRNRTWVATFATASRISFTSSAVNPLAARCSRRVRTASYSTISGTDDSSSAAPSNTLSKICREAPRSLRRAATSTSVSRSHRTPYDITRNITRNTRIVS